MREMRDPGCENEGVSPTPDQHVRARRIAAQITAGLARTGFALPGTLTERMTRCGHPTCRCHADPPRLHGPYHQWTRKIKVTGDEEELLAFYDYPAEHWVHLRTTNPIESTFATVRLGRRSPRATGRRSPGWRWRSS